MSVGKKAKTSPIGSEDQRESTLGTGASGWRGRLERLLEAAELRVVGTHSAQSLKYLQLLFMLSIINTEWQESKLDTNTWHVSITVRATFPPIRRYPPLTVTHQTKCKTLSVLKSSHIFEARHEQCPVEVPPCRHAITQSRKVLCWLLWETRHQRSRQPLNLACYNTNLSGKIGPTGVIVACLF